MLFNIISRWPDIIKTLAAIVVFVSGTALGLNVLFTLIGATAKLLGLDRFAGWMTKAAGAVSWFGAEVHVLAIKYGILPKDEKKPDAPAGGATASGSAFRDALTGLGDESTVPIALPRALRRTGAFTFLVVCLTLAAGLITTQIEGCGIFGSKDPQVEHAAIDVGVCVLEHALAGESVKQIAADCKDVTEKDVIDILAAHKKLAAKEYGGPVGAPAPSSSASSCPTGK